VPIHSFYMNDEMLNLAHQVLRGRLVLDVLADL
jgi:hypothetical protein